MLIINTALVIIFSLTELPIIVANTEINSWKRYVVIGLVLVITNLVVFFDDDGVASVLVLINRLSTVFFAVWLSIEDIDSHLLPNGILAVWLIFRAILILITSIVENSINAVISSGTGAATIGILMLGIRILSKRALGSGDVKLGVAMGFALAFKTALFAVIIGFFLCALYSVFQMLIRSKNCKTQLPLGPFWFVGIIITLTTVRQ